MSCEPDCHSKSTSLCRRSRPWLDRPGNTYVGRCDMCPSDCSLQYLRASCRAYKLGRQRCSYNQCELLLLHEETSGITPHRKKLNVVSAETSKASQFSLLCSYLAAKLPHYIQKILKTAQQPGHFLLSWFVTVKMLQCCPQPLP